MDELSISQKEYNRLRKRIEAMQVELLNVISNDTFDVAVFAMVNLLTQGYKISSNPAHQKTKLKELIDDVWEGEYE